MAESSEDALASVALFSGNEVLRGWEAVNIARSLTELSGTFSLVATELHPDDPLARTLTADSAVTVVLGDDVVIDGWVFGVSTAYGPAKHSVKLTGADFSLDLQHSSADRAPGHWSGQTLEQIARDLLNPFENLSLLPGESTGQPLAKFTLRTGESVAQALTRAARLAGLLVTGDGLGGVRFTKPGIEVAPTSIKRATEGVGRIKAAVIDESSSDRFSTYKVFGQTDSSEAAALIAQWGGVMGPPQSGTATDPGVRRHRPKVLLEGSNAAGGRLQKRALLEASTRAARSKTVGYVLDGWRSADNWLWQPGYLVPVYDPLLAIGTDTGAARELLIVNVGFSVSATGGAETKLKLMDPVAFQTLPLPPAADPVGLWEVST